MAGRSIRWGHSAIATSLDTLKRRVLDSTPERNDRDMRFVFPTRRGEMIFCICTNGLSPATEVCRRE